MEHEATPQESSKSNKVVGPYKTVVLQEEESVSSYLNSLSPFEEVVSVSPFVVASSIHLGGTVTLVMVVTKTKSLFPIQING